MLKTGLIWRIGDGTKVRIWRDKWIPRASSLMLMGRSGRCRLRWVSQLLKQGEKSWDVDLIKHVCHPLDVEEILKINLSPYQDEDFLAWHYEKSGIFSVRSAYRLAWLNKFHPDGEGSSRETDGDRSIWRRIWSTPVPPKVRIFAWRLARNYLATQKNRCKRKLQAVATCTICGQGEEDEFHAVISCTRPRALRETLRASWRLPDERSLSKLGPGWLLGGLDKLSENERAQFLLVLWRAWYLRNDCVFGSGQATVKGSASFLLNLWNSLCPSGSAMLENEKGKIVSEGRQSDVNGCGERTQVAGVWQAPAMGWVKING